MSGGNECCEEKFKKRQGMGIGNGNGALIYRGDQRRYFS